MRPRTMLLLLAPSERKAPPPADADHPPLELATLVHPELTARRERLLTALERLAAGRLPRALEALGLSEAQADEVARDGALRAAPAGPAAEVYTGVLYEHLDWPTLGPAARERAAGSMLVASALWGVVAPGDRIPAYRLSIGARLPRIDGGGPLASGWRPPLAKALPDDPDELVVDLRSGSYSAAWKPKRATRVEVGALDAQGRVVSHMVKATRGAVARRLLEAGRAPTTPQEVAELAPGPGEDVRIEAPARAGAPWTVRVLLP